MSVLQKLTHDEILQERLTVEASQQAERNPIYVMLHNIRSLYNVGSIFRTSDASLIQELILCGYTPAPPRQEIDKTSLGAVNSVPWTYEKNIITAIDKLKEKNIKIIAVELTNKKRSYLSLQKQEFPLCLIFGNELTGIDDEILDKCDDSIEIPMLGVKHSLNVSVSVGITLFEAINAWNNH